MNRLLITNDFPPTVSGISTLFYNIWKLLPAEDWSVLTPITGQDKDFDGISAINTFRYRYLNSASIFAKIINQLVLFIYAGRTIIFKKTGMLHCGQLLSSGSIGLLFKKAAGLPYCLWVYGDETKDIYRGNVFSKYIVDGIIRNAYKIISISSYVTKEFLDFGVSPERIVEILPAVDPYQFSGNEKNEQFIESYNLRNKKVILTVSRLARRKGHEAVLYALKKVKEKLTDIAYLIVGKGPEEDRLRSLSKSLGLEGEVIFAGHVPDNVLADYYNLCDIFVMPNREDPGSTDSIEGFGIVFLEANACGKPVIGGRSGGVVDGAIEDGINGFLVDPLDTDQLAEKIVCLLTDVDLYKQISENSVQRVRKHFLWEDRAKLLTEI